MSHKLIRQFREIRRSGRLSSHAADLFLLLFDEHNKAKWRNPFEVRTLDILNETRMSRPTLIKAQKELSDAGLVKIHTSNNPKNGSYYSLLLVKEIYNSPNLLVKEVYNLLMLLVKEIYKLAVVIKEIDNLPPLLVKEVYNSKKEITPHTPHKEKIYNIYSNDDNDAGADALTREGLAFYQTRCLDPLFREKGERACAGVHDAYESLCVETLTDWAAVGEPIDDTPDCCRHFLSTLRIKAETLRKARLSVTSMPIEERKRRFMEEIKAVRDAGDPGFYNREVLNAFYKFFTQPTSDGTMLAFETKPYWDTKTRLDKWIQQENRHRP